MSLLISIVLFTEATTLQCSVSQVESGEIIRNSETQLNVLVDWPRALIEGDVEPRFNGVWAIQRGWHGSFDLDHETAGSSYFAHLFAEAEGQRWILIGHSTESTETPTTVASGYCVGDPIEFENEQ